ncbi:MAG: hypothetical protein QXY79_03180 [Candidatus Methanomethylicia archaeon]
MYNDLIEALQRELEFDSLSTLPKDFYMNVRLYFKGLMDKIESSPEDLAELLKYELDLTMRMISTIFELRIYKMIKHIFSGAITPPEGLLDEELEAYVKIKEAISTVLQSLNSSIKSLDIITKRILVRFTASVSEFVGVDLVVYGPFEPEDVANIPLINSEALILKGVAEKLE